MSSGRFRIASRTSLLLGKMQVSDLQAVDEGLPSTQPGLQANRIIINVGGIRFETYKSTLRNIPDTRLAWITESKADNPDYDPLTGEYFFDRHPDMFLMILNYYRTGKLHAPSDVCGPAFEDELAFWGIDEKQIESCCWGGYSRHRDAQSILKELKIDNLQEDTEDDLDDACFGSTAEKFGIIEETAHTKTCWQKWRPKIWSYLENPYSSKAGFVMKTLSLLLTVSVIISFVCSTLPVVRVNRNETIGTVSVSYESINQRLVHTKPPRALDWVENGCMMLLTLEFLARLLTCPHHGEFFARFLNWVDILSLFPYFLMVALEFLFPWLLQDKIYLIIFDIIKFIRVIKLGTIMSHMEGLKILFHTLKVSAKELLLVALLIILLVTGFGSLIYIAERFDEGERNDFESIPIGIWWAIITMTTIGYGDKVPRSWIGYFVGSFCAVCGLLFMTLPIPIIVNNFSNYYSHAKAQQKLPKKKKHALVGAADALKQQIPDDFVDIDDETSPSGSRSSSPPKHETTTIKKSNDENMANSDDSGVNLSSVKSDKTASGISVTFTDVDPESSPELRIRVPTISEPNKADASVTNWHASFPQKQANGFVTPGRKASSPAVICSSSILPGGVPDQIPGSGGPMVRKASLAIRPSPKERRRSLMPTISYLPE